MNLQVTIVENEYQSPSFTFDYSTNGISIKIDFEDNSAVNAFQWRLFIYKIENRTTGYINYTDDDGSISIRYDGDTNNVTFDVGRADPYAKCTVNSYITIPADRCIDALTTAADALEAWESN